VFVILSILFFEAARTTASVGILELLGNNLHLLGAVLCLALVFAAVKICCWRVVFRCHGISLTFSKLIELFYISAFIDLLVFPARVASDSYKALVLKDFPLRDRLKAIVLFRVASTLPFILVVLGFLFVRNSIVTLLILVLLIVLLFVVRARLGFLKEALAKKGAFLYVLLATLLLIVSEYYRASFLLMLFKLAPEPLFLLEFGLAHAVGVVSGLPIGLGAEDLSLAFFLRDDLSLVEIAIFLAVFRLSGEFFSAFIGWGISGKQSISRILNALKEQHAGKRTNRP